MKRESNSLWSYLRHGLVIVALVALTFTIYSGTYDHPFAFDDANSITENWIAQVSELSGSNLYAAAFKSRPDGRRPLAFASFAVNHAFGGLNPRGYHAVNIAIHAVNGVLVYFFALLTFRQLHRLTTKERRGSTPDWSVPMALFAAGLFVAHPIQTQAVTYIVQRMTSMATLFYLLALLCYLLGRLQPWGAWRISLWCGVPICFALSWGSKQLALPLILIIPLYEWFFFQDLSIAWFKRRDVQVIALVALLLAVGVGLAGMATFEEKTAWNPLVRLNNGYSQRDFTMMERLYTQPRVVLRYMYLLALPIPDNLSLLHEIETSTSLFSPPSSILSLATIFGLLGLAIWLAPRQRLISFAILWFFIHLAIESTILPLEMMYEHRLYLPMVGVALGLSYVLWTLLARHAVWASVVSCVLVAVLSMATVDRNKDWADIYEDVLTKNPNSLRARLGRGLSLLKMSDRANEEEQRLKLLRKAADDFAVVIERKPDALNSRPEEENKRFDSHVLDAYVAHAEVTGILGVDKQEVLDQYQKVESIDPKFDKIYVSRGNFLARRKEFPEAIEQYNEALTVRLKNLKKKNGTDAMLGEPAAEVYLNRALCFSQLGDIQSAIADLEKAISLKPSEDRARILRAQMSLKLGDSQTALDDMNRVLQRRPTDVQSHFLRAQAALQLGRFAEAEKGFRGVLQRNSGNRDAALGLIHVLTLAKDPSIRRPREAVALATRLCEATKRQDHRALYALARAQANAGQFSAAIATFDEAIALAPDEIAATYRGEKQKIPSAASRPGRPR